MTNLQSRRSLTLLRFGLALAAAVVLATGCNVHFGTGVEAHDVWSKNYTVKAGATLVVRETNGSVHIRAFDGDQIEVSATKVTKAPTEEGAKDMLKDFNISENATPDRVELGGDSQGFTLSFNRSRWVDYDIKVPRSAAVTIKTTNGDVSVRDVGGFLRVESVNGSTSAEGLADGADVSSTNGEVELAFAKVGDSGVRCKSVNGEISVTIPASGRATVAVRTVNGGIHTENLVVQKGDDSRRRLDATVGGGGPEVRVETTNGDVRVVGK